jgi:hypothetical protein
MNEIKNKISEINKQIKSISHEIDNNFNLSSIKIRDKKKEINQL